MLCEGKYFCYYVEEIYSGITNGRVLDEEIYTHEMTVLHLFWIKYDLDKSITHSKLDLTGSSTHALQIMTVYYMSLRGVL